MGLHIAIHPVNPQPRLLRQVADILREGGIAVLPSDSGYVIGCRIGDKDSLERIRRLRGLGEDHYFTLMCRDLSEIATYAKVGTIEYRLIKAHTPGAYTFVLKATHEVPRRLQHPKRKTVGLRVPDHLIAQGVLAEMGEPMLVTSLILPSDLSERYEEEAGLLRRRRGGGETGETAFSDPEDIRDRLLGHIDVLVDGGFCDETPTTVLDLSDEPFRVLRAGTAPLPPGFEPE
ncbi:MAG: L-threonylcarbamoyladenylate synthase [Halothiobacillaceae bacterium]|nr:L-threonylcarbamoyladenylate synthase [Halothiobacillaceae bacterium]